MNPDVLEKVLNCRDLPSLPAVAMRVVQLTSTENVSVNDLAETIQNDQAISIKILKTVNSSLYGMRKPCSNISQAIVMLGLSTVKTLALSFSLVGAIRDASDNGFDMESHWRRALFSGIAGKAVATHARLPNADEAFLGGLLEDVGMIALYKALGPEYLAILEESGGNHRKVCKAELRAFELQHPDVGAMLASRWKLPESLVMPIKYHEHPTAAPLEHAAICRAVGLGNIAADLLSSTEPAPLLRKFYTRAEQWFGMTTPEADDVLALISQSTKEVSRLLSVPTGDVSNLQALLEVARKQLGEMKIPANDDRELRPTDPFDLGVDELTGVATRLRFDQSFIAAFEIARSGTSASSVMIFEIDKLDAIVAQNGRDAADTLLIALAGRFERILGSPQTLVARFDESRLAVLISKTDRVTGTRLADTVRQQVLSQPIQLIAANAGSPAELSVTVSGVVAMIDAATIARFDQSGALLAVLDKALASAKKAGGNTIRVFTPPGAQAQQAA